MIIDMRNHEQDCSITKALALAINPLELDQSIIIEWLIDVNGKKKNPAYLRSFISSATRNRSFFRSRMTPEGLMIWRIASGDIMVKKKRGKPNHWPFADMNVGETEVVTIGEYGSANPQTYAHTVGAALNMKFNTKVIGSKYYITRTD
jgi:hypothetical protein